MIDDNKIILVVNKSHGSVSYDLPELHGLHRRFEYGETKKLPFNELRMLSYSTGGLNLLQEYLTIMDEEVVEELLGQVEPEYYYSRKEIEELLKFGTLDQLEDCLNFAPKGILDMVKGIAMELKINAVDKRKMISDKFGINLDRAIELQIEQEAENEPVKPVVRKAAATSATTSDVAPAPARKASPVKIVSKKEEA